MIELPEHVRAYFIALNNIDRDAFLACFTSDAVARDPYGVAEFDGESGLNKFFDSMERTWRDFQMDPQAAYSGGERIAVPWNATSTAKNGKSAAFAGVNVFTLGEGDKIQELDAYWDMKAMVAQIR